MKSVILVVEDEQELREFLTDILRDQGYVVFSTATGAHALKLVEKVQPNLVVLDLGLPDISGETVCSRIKTDFPRMPVIILTASDETQHIVGSFDRGADDYIKKPFVNEELLARIKSKLRILKRDDPVIVSGDLILNTDTLDVKRGNKRINLTHTEFELLYYLMINANRVLTREQILGHVWVQNPDIETRVVDVYIGYLRKKIDKGFTEKMIQSKRGFGYVLKARNKTNTNFQTDQATTDQLAL